MDKFERWTAHLPDEEPAVCRQADRPGDSDDFDGTRTCG
jgi:hypothetical protein